MKLDVKQKVGQLKQLRYLKGEVMLLSRRIERLEAEIEADRRVRWRGTADHRARLIALRERLARKRERCMAQLEALYGFIGDIGDSRLRQIMAGRYIDGLTWKEVAVRIGEASEQYPRRLHNRFLGQVELPPALVGIGRTQGDTEHFEGRNDSEAAKG